MLVFTCSIDNKTQSMLIVYIECQSCLNYLQNTLVMESSISKWHYNLLCNIAVAKANSPLVIEFQPVST